MILNLSDLKQAIRDTIYTNTSADVSGDEVRDRMVDIADSAFAAAGGSGPAPSTLTARLGLSADATPEASELTISMTDGVGSIGPWTGSQRLLIARLASEPDIVSVTFSDDPSMDNEIHAFSKHGSTVDYSGRDYDVWVSNQPLIQAAAVTVTVR